MLKKYKKGMREYSRFGVGMAATGIGVGVGSQVVGEVGGAGAAGVQAGLGKITGAMPIVGSIMASGMVVRSLGMLQPERKSKGKKK